jgi:hypothetical protein
VERSVKMRTRGRRLNNIFKRRHGDHRQFAANCAGRLGKF